MSKSFKQDVEKIKGFTNTKGARKKVNDYLKDLYKVPEESDETIFPDIKPDINKTYKNGFKKV